MATKITLYLTDWYVTQMWHILHDLHFVFQNLFDYATNKLDLNQSFELEIRKERREYFWKSK